MHDAIMLPSPASKIRRLGSLTGTQAAARNLTVLSFACMASYLPAIAQSGGAYKVPNIVSDGSVPAITTDATFTPPRQASNHVTFATPQPQALPLFCFYPLDPS